MTNHMILVIIKVSYSNDLSKKNYTTLERNVILIIGERHISMYYIQQTQS